MIEISIDSFACCLALIHISRVPLRYQHRYLAPHRESERVRRECTIAIDHEEITFDAWAEGTSTSTRCGRRGCELDRCRSSEHQEPRWCTIELHEYDRISVRELRSSIAVTCSSCSSQEVWYISIVYKRTWIS